MANAGIHMTFRCPPLLHVEVEHLLAQRVAQQSRKAKTWTGIIAEALDLLIRETDRRQSYKRVTSDRIRKSATDLVPPVPDAPITQPQPPDPDTLIV